MDPIISLARPGKTRKELRRMLGMRLGDLIPLVATANSSGLTTFIDEVNLNEDVDSYAGRYAFFCGGQAALLGLTKYVNGSSLATHSLTFSVDLPVPAAIGDELHLVNWSGVGFTPNDYHEAMNDTLRSAGESHDFIPMRVNVSSSYDATTNTIQLPPEFYFLDQLEEQHPYSGWQIIPGAREDSRNGWWIDEATAQIVLPTDRCYPGTSPYVSSPYPMRITGYGIPPEMTDDSSVAMVPTEWFVEEAAARLLEKNISMNPGLPNRDRIYMQLRQHADSIRPTLTVRMGSHTMRVR